MQYQTSQETSYAAIIYIYLTFVILAFIIVLCMHCIFQNYYVGYGQGSVTNLSMFKKKSLKVSVRGMATKDELAFNEKLINFFQVDR